MIRTAEKEEKTLVVGTTTDYIDWIRTVDPGQALFLTDSDLRHQAKEAAPGSNEEILRNFDDYDNIFKVINEHLAAWNITLNGIACFDCESMDLAARLAERYALPYPSRHAVKLCRSKYLSKETWERAGLRCSYAANVRSGEDAANFLQEWGGKAVLKPLTGSGSEHIYLCETEYECRSRYQEICAALQDRQGHRLYHSTDPVTELIVAEEFIGGEEYSCDFMVDGSQTALIRLTKKIRALNRAFGTIQAYVLCDAGQEGIEPEKLIGILGQSAKALEIERGICMLDFMVRDGEIVLLELAPRPGGDCLPQLLLHARGIDILKLTLDIARQGMGLPSLPQPVLSPRFMGIRIIADQAGTLDHIDTSLIKDDPRVLAVGITKEPGQKIALPPIDYDSWILGHIVAQVEPGEEPEAILAELLGKTRVVIS